MRHAACGRQRPAYQPPSQAASHVVDSKLCQNGKAKMIRAIKTLGTKSQTKPMRVAQTNEHSLLTAYCWPRAGLGLAAGQPRAMSHEP